MFSMEGRRCHVVASRFLTRVFARAGPLLPGSEASTIIMVVFNTSHSSSELQLSAASLEGGGCTILRSWVKILTFRSEAVLRIAKIGSEGFGMSRACFDELICVCAYIVLRESSESRR